MISTNLHELSAVNVVSEWSVTQMVYLPGREGREREGVSVGHVGRCEKM